MKNQTNYMPISFKKRLKINLILTQINLNETITYYVMGMKKLSAKLFCLCCHYGCNIACNVQSIVLRIRSARRPVCSA